MKYNGDYERDLEIGRVMASKYIEVTSEVMAKDKYKSNSFTKEYLRLLKED